MKSTCIVTIMAATLAASISLPAHASSIAWDAFVIRDGSSGAVPSITENADGVGVTTSIVESDQKTGYGTAGLDGKNVGSILSFNYDRIDGGNKDPYLNIWVTDGSHYALIAPVVNATSAGNYSSTDVRGQDMQTLGFNIYDNSGSNYDWLVTGATRTQSMLTANGSFVTLADIANLKIGENSSPVSDTGAPQNGDGFNIVFGDTQNNFVQSTVPYQIDNVQVTTAVPLPSAAGMGLAALAMIGGGALVRRKLRLA